MGSPVRRSVTGLACLLCLGLSGCQTLKEEKTVDFGPGVYKLYVTAPSTDQKVNVSITSTEPVCAYLCLEENEAAVERESYNSAGPKQDLLLGGERERKKEITFDSSASVPARKSFLLLVNCERKTHMTVKLVGK
jgi:hypothetical protein